MLVESFLEDEELARTALSCHLPLDLFLPGDARCMVVCVAGRSEVIF